MLKRPSSRRKSKPEEIVLNLVPILDTLVALIAFMLFTMTFLVLVSVETPFPVASEEAARQALQEKPLQLTVSLGENDARVWSPFNLVPERIFPNVGPGQPDLQAIHDHLVAIKQKFPNERKVVFNPHSSVPYDVLIALMDSSRLLLPTDPPVYAEQGGASHAIGVLFPEVIFGNLLGDS